jgi:electron transport complex protein RnfE
MLPPGAFIIMGLFIALKNVIDKKLKERQPEAAVQPSVTRARITKVG